jgi:ABC-type oligopeptide transport system ATPase subunit
MATIVEVRGLTKQFRVAGAEPLTAVKNVDLDIVVYDSVAEN